MSGEDVGTRLQQHVHASGLTMSNSFYQSLVDEMLVWVHRKEFFQDRFVASDCRCVDRASVLATLVTNIGTAIEQFLYNIDAIEIRRCNQRRVVLALPMVNKVNRAIEEVLDDRHICFDGSGL
jgi:hypothetical protein